MTRFSLLMTSCRFLVCAGDSEILFEWLIDLRNPDIV